MALAANRKEEVLAQLRENFFRHYTWGQLSEKCLLTLDQWAEEQPPLDSNHEQDLVFYLQGAPEEFVTKWLSQDRQRVQNYLRDAIRSLDLPNSYKELAKNIAYGSTPELIQQNYTEYSNTIDTAITTAEKLLQNRRLRYDTGPNSDGMIIRTARAELIVMGQEFATTRLRSQVDATKTKS